MVTFGSSVLRILMVIARIKDYPCTTIWSASHNHRSNSFLNTVSHIFRRWNPKVWKTPPFSASFLGSVSESAVWAICTFWATMDKGLFHCFEPLFPWFLWYHQPGNSSRRSSWFALPESNRPTRYWTIKLFDHFAGIFPNLDWDVLRPISPRNILCTLY